MSEQGQQRRRATMKDVAARAGVGLSTVSRVVSGKGGVSKAKMRAVERAVRELDFQRNDFAHTLRTGTAGTIGVVVTTIADPFYANLVQAVESNAQARDVLVLVASATDDPVEARRVLQRVLRRRLDGLIIVVPEGADIDFLRKDLDHGMPAVFVDRPPRDLDADLVVVENEAGMASAVTHLARHGHTRIACFAHVVGAYTSARRVEGYRRGVADVGIAPDDALIANVSDDVEACSAALTRMLALPQPPTAIVATNSRTTKAVVGALRALDVRLALVGFDDFELAELLVPPVTTVAQDPRAIGDAAATLLFDRIGGLTGPRRRIVLGTSLIDRGSALA